MVEFAGRSRVIGWRGEITLWSITASNEFAQGGCGVLARRTIRTKLMIVLALMIAVIVLLASSAFWGLQRYRGLADAISLQADEIAYTNRLSRSAESIRDIGHRLRHLHGENEGSPLLEHRRENETFLFEFALREFERLLTSFKRRTDPTRSEKLLFIAPQKRSESVEAMSAQLAKVWDIYARPAIQRDEASLSTLRQELDVLAAETEELTTLMHTGMAAFSSDVRGEYRTWIVVTWICLAASIVIFVVLAGLFHSFVVKPFRTLIGGSRLVAAGQFDHHIDLGTGDELSELAGVVNAMTRRFRDTCVVLEQERADLDRQVRDRTREVVQREQLASVGFLAAGVAHEINNPLASIAWSAEALESRLYDVIHGDDACRTLAADQAIVLGQNLRRIQDEAYRCKGITERLLDFSRLGDVERTRVDVCELVQDVVAMVGTLGKYRCKTLRADCPGNIIALINGQQIRQVALNLITNALESVDVSGAVEVRVRRDEAVVRVTVEDNGCGMTEEVLEHLFEPFFTRRSDGSGTGLGLSITHRIVTQHGGKLTAHSDGPQCGSTLQFELPIDATNGNSNESATSSRNAAALGIFQNDRDCFANTPQSAATLIHPAA